MRVPKWLSSLAFKVPAMMIMGAAAAALAVGAGAYVLARDSKSLRVHGKTYYFCSDDCRKRFANK